MSLFQFHCLTIFLWAKLSSYLASQSALLDFFIHCNNSIFSTVAVSSWEILIMFLSQFLFTSNGKVSFSFHNLLLLPCWLGWPLPSLKWCLKSVLQLLPDFISGSRLELTDIYHIYRLSGSIKMQYMIDMIEWLNAFNRYGAT